jgi:hypothetical protein
MSLIKRLVKGTPLTFAEGDANLDFLENLANNTSSFAVITGPNQFEGTQTIYGDLTVYGTSSIQYTTSSQAYIGDSLIVLSTDLPSLRFGGISVYDSGSSALSGSLFWDSQRQHWVYANPSGSTYDGGLIISGPKNTNGLGNEQGLLNNVITKGQGSDHITSSALIEDGTTFTSKVNTVISGSLDVTGIIYGSIAGSIASASYAQTSSYSVVSISSSFATNSTSASYSNNSRSSSFATTATSASFATTSTSASFATTSISSSYSATAQTASYVLNAVSSSYALSSSLAQTASFVTTAQTASYVLNAVSSSYALSSSYAISSSNTVSSSYALSSSYAISSSNAINASNANLLEGIRRSTLATTGSNTFIGNQTISGSLNVTGSVIIQGMYVGTGNGALSTTNVAVGANSLLSNVSGAYNVAIGGSNLSNLNGNSIYNTSVGNSAGANLMSGSYNTFIGRDSGDGLVSGSFNTFIGSVLFATSSILNNTIIIADGANQQRLIIDSTGLTILSDGLYTSGSTTISGSLTVQRSTAILSQVSQSFNFANDLAASGSGIPLGGLYHTSGTIKIRLV